MACRCGSKYAVKTNAYGEGMGIVDISHTGSKRQSMGNYMYDLGDSDSGVPALVGLAIVGLLAVKFFKG